MTDSEKLYSTARVGETDEWSATDMTCMLHVTNVTDSLLKHADTTPPLSAGDGLLVVDLYRPVLPRDATL